MKSPNSARNTLLNILYWLQLTTVNMFGEMLLQDHVESSYLYSYAVFVVGQ